MSSTEVTTRAPRGWVALSAGSRSLVVQGSASVAGELQGPLAAGLVQVLDALGRDGLGGLPDFALVDTSGERARVIVRGSALVRADGSDVAADGRMPWRDVDVEASALELTAAGARGGWPRPTRLGRPVVAAAAVAPAPTPAPAPVAPPAEGPAEEPEAAVPDAAVDPQPPADLTLPPSEEYAGAAPAARIPEPEPVRPGKKVLIDSVPWRTLPDEAGPDAPQPGADDASAAGAPAAPDVPPPPPVVPEPAPSPADGPTGPDNWGMTGPAPFQQPATAEAAEAAADEPAAPDVTMDRSALAPGIAGPADSPIVLAVICPAGHHSSPHASTCRVCDRDIPTQQPFQTPRPQLGVLHVSAGGQVPLDRGILLGRSPKVNSDLPPSSRPHLVRLASRDNDISRNHAEVILEGWHVLVRDLGSTNGTTVTLPGQEPVRLRPTEDFGIEPGAVVTLADEVSLTYEVSE